MSWMTESGKARIRKYNQRPEVKARKAAYMRKWRAENPERAKESWDRSNKKRRQKPESCPSARKNDPAGGLLSSEGSQS